MVSFVCNACQETLKKPKLDMHANRCHYASFSCIDCSVDFVGTSYRQHTSCISEAEKYEGKLYKKGKQNNAQQKPSSTPKSTVDQLTARAQQLANCETNETPASPKKRKSEDANGSSDKKKKSAWDSTDISDDATTAMTNAIAYVTQAEPRTEFADLRKKCVKLVTKHPQSKLSKSDVKSVFDKALVEALGSGKVALVMPKST
ncbi:hypothetical protein GGH19_003122 [Coemansia sp. RSA 1807]|nr:hypothetical protein IW142_003780 [Coemansia sp. RSA 564]KAJ2163654.1 hypothetical protein GGH15_004349 [Coemansia sp. RSA 562]KAJ2190570.1 hypothetical protein IW144_005360 [Coemansia sp. RSA 522]KAJ2218617.1 hypothetical protein EV180_005664 [Coemansia sp. RSA 518]KAJ2247749.1 hypothetical protein GGH98_003973 [Coemansia sp. RSA 454]KAJ2405921.1 hypothetical protein J3F80_003840 [Coemansia sp. RSA 2526]KAJ2575288.1 hypothetical protein GGH19_003122 [Coemansia sp. RSA 1807]